MAILIVKSVDEVWTEFILFLKSIAMTTGTWFISQKFSLVISMDLEEKVSKLSASPLLVTEIINSSKTLR